MKPFFRKHGKDMVFVCVFLLCVVLIGAMAVLLIRYSDNLEEQAVSRVENYSVDTTTQITILF